MNATTGTTTGQQEVPADESSAADPTDGTGDERATLVEDDLFHLLQNYRRRAVVRYLRGREGPVEMRDVAEQVAAWEHDTTLEALTSTQRQRVYIALYQSHLETLEDAGVIEYNKPRGIVDPTPLLDHVATYVDVDSAPTPDRSGEATWERRYLGVSLVGTVLLVGTALDLTVFQLVSSFAASVLILIMFSMLTFAKLTIEQSVDS
ncbi:MAG: hypothetical protein ABEJ68_10855 [Halobacteriaceae archaeon]